jgi:hypothetical protein
MLGEEVDGALQHSVHCQVCAASILRVGQEVLQIRQKLLGL